MVNMEKNKQKWVILFLVWLGVFMTTYAQNQLSALSTDLIDTYGFTAEQYSSIYSSPNWVAVVLGIFVGVFSDKIGVRKMLTIAGILCIIGTVTRIFTTSYNMLFFTGLLTGFVACVASCNRAKVLGAWFTKEQMGIAMGICMTVTPVASTIGIGTTAMLPSIPFAFGVVAVISVVFLVLWILFGKDRPDDVPAPASVPVWANLGEVVKSKWIWILAIAGYAIQAGQVTTMAFISAAIQSRGYDPSTAGLLSTGMTIGCGFGAVITPMIIRAVGRYRPVIAAYVLLGAACLYFGWQMPNVPALLIVLFIAGFILASFISLLYTFPIFVVGQEKVSTATGIISTVGLLGAATGLTYVVLPITGMDFTKIYLVAAIGLAISGILMFCLPEYGTKAQKA